MEGREAINWSEIVEDLLEEGKTREAICILESVISLVKKRKGSSSDLLKISAASETLSQIYVTQNESNLGKELASKAAQLREEARLLSCTELESKLDNGDLSAKFESLTIDSGHKEQEVTGQDSEEDWERSLEEHGKNLVTLQGGRPSQLPAERTLSAGKKGRGKFMYGTPSMYRESKTSDSPGGKQEVEGSWAQNNSSFFKPLSPELTGPTHDSHVTGFKSTAHVLEVLKIHQSTIRTEDLDVIFRGFIDSNVYFRWVDKKRALAVFSSSAMALRALQEVRDEGYQLRAIPKNSSLVAFVTSSDLQPATRRPLTSARAAQRMILGALSQAGVKGASSKPGGKSEEEKRLEAERKTRLNSRYRQREDAWGDDE